VDARQAARAERAMREIVVQAHDEMAQLF
jgi:hypothetical protein